MLLVAAIALANRGWNSRPSSGAAEDPLSAEVPHSRQGAQSTAAKAAAAIGSERMFAEDQRHGIVQAIADPPERGRLQAQFDKGYSLAFNKQIGLDEEGRAPAGATFVSRTMPAGTTVRHYSPREATVDVWCSGLFGLTGKGVTEIPVKESWFTITMTLRWTDDGWRLAESTQKDGPNPDSAAAYGQVPPL
ncbi:hypothetical protein [Streptomyces sp. LN325]|uniref:hypothetical protein n=1 Tax=Streptomyces sp. LN325 TaxID=3112976 RepID=UPI003721AC39